MNVLVTGGAGFIGSHLVDQLVGDGHFVRSLDVLEPQVHGVNRTNPEHLNPKCEYLLGDCGFQPDIKAALRDIEIVFHLASLVGVGQSMRELARYTDQNALVTATFLEQVVRAKPKRLIVASSMSVYGEGLPDRGTPETHPVMPQSVYGLTKKYQEDLCLMMGQMHKIPTVACRFFNVYGERQSLNNPFTGVVAIFANKLLHGEAPLISDDGQQVRDFVHVADVVENVIELMQSDCEGVFNIGTGKPHSIWSVAQMLNDALTDGKVPPVILGTHREGDVRCCYADNTKFTRLFPHTYIDLSHGVFTLRDWLLKSSDALLI